MKKVIAILLVLTMAIGLCACGNSQEKEIIAVLTQEKWVSHDRRNVINISDDWTQIMSEYWMIFYEDGSYKGGYTEVDYYYDETEKHDFTGTWMIENGTIILDKGNPYISEERYTLKNGVLYAPAAEGYTYVQE